MPLTDAAASPDAAIRLRSTVNLATPFAIRVVAALGVADQLAAGVHDVNALAAAVEVDAEALARLLRYLVHQGVFTEDQKGHFDLTEVSRELLDRSPAGMGGRMDLAYTGLLHSMRTGEVAYPVVHGQTSWADPDSERHRRFIDEPMVVQGSRTSLAAGRRSLRLERSHRGLRCRRRQRPPAVATARPAPAPARYAGGPSQFRPACLRHLVRPRRRPGAVAGGLRRDRRGRRPGAGRRLPGAAGAGAAGVRMRAALTGPRPALRAPWTRSTRRSGGIAP